MDQSIYPGAISSYPPPHRERADRVQQSGGNYDRRQVGVVNLHCGYQTIQYIAWFIAISEFIVGLYIIIINPRRAANRHVAVFLMITAINSYAVGLIGDDQQYK